MKAKILKRFSERDSVNIIIAASLALFIVACFTDVKADDNVVPPKTPILTAHRLIVPVSIDGKLDEEVWQQPGTSTFTQRNPDEGAAPTQKTEVWVAYDDAALYVAARMYDNSPDSIVSRIGRRDADLSSDWLYVGIDSYHDRRTAFFFAVNPGGSIQDGTFFNDEDSDNSWDGVWDEAAAIDDKGWTVEMRIPYSQLRFPKQDEYTWGIEFERIIDRRKEDDWLVMIPKKESGFVSRFADLVGIHDIHPPVRLEVLPYVVTSNKLTNQFDSGDPFHKTSTFSGNAGADIKYGLGSNLTLNATFNPDFGQVEVDPAVVNLSQFETFFDEKRPFFIEGSDVFRFGNGGVNSSWGFNWGNPNFFYSRRIGRPPEGDVQHSGFSDIPDRTTIIAAGKITGKISDGWSLGSLHAITAREYAQVEDNSGTRYSDVVEPFTSYNVFRSLKEFNQGRQGFGILGTAALHDLNQPYLVDNFNHRAFSAGLDGWTNLDSTQTYVLTGWFASSRIEGTSNRILSVEESPLHYFQRPDARYVHLDSNATSLSGYAGRIAVNKQKGNFSFNAAVGVITPSFDTEDLGFLFRTDVINAHVVAGYQWFEPDGTFRRKNFNLATFRNFDFDGDKTGEGYFFFWNAQLMNYWNIQGNLIFSPAVFTTTNTRSGPKMKNTNSYDGYVYCSTDYRNSVIYNFEIDLERSESGGYTVVTSPGIEWKPNSTIDLKFYPSFFRDVTVAQWVTQQTDPSATATYGSRYIFGFLDQRQASATIRMDWTFTPRLSLQLYMQPLISVGSYNEFKELKQPGTYTFNTYGKDNNSSIIQDASGNYIVDPDGTGLHDFSFSNPDFNFKSLRGNAVLRWEYMSGSALYVVWTRGQTNGDYAGDFNFRRDLGGLLTAQDHDDVFLVKLAYWWNP